MNSIRKEMKMSEEREFINIAYYVVAEDNLQDLSVEVMSCLSGGHKLEGGITFANGLYMQATTKDFGQRSED